MASSASGQQMSQQAPKPAGPGQQQQQQQQPQQHHEQRQQHPPLQILHSMFNAVLLQTGDTLSNPSATSPKAMNFYNARLRTLLPGLHERFHYALDQLEMEMLHTKAVLRRDLRRVQEKNAEENAALEAKKRVEEEKLQKEREEAEQKMAEERKRLREEAEKEAAADQEKSKATEATPKSEEKKPEQTSNEPEPIVIDDEGPVSAPPTAGSTGDFGSLFGEEENTAGGPASAPPSTQAAAGADDFSNFMDLSTENAQFDSFDLFGPP